MKNCDCIISTFWSKHLWRAELIITFMIYNYLQHVQRHSLCQYYWPSRLCLQKGYCILNTLKHRINFIAPIMIILFALTKFSLFFNSFSYHKSGLRRLKFRLINSFINYIGLCFRRINYWPFFKCTISSFWNDLSLVVDQVGHHYWRAINFDQRSVITAIEQCEFFNVPLWHETSLH